MKTWLCVFSFMLVGCASQQVAQNRYYIFPVNEPVRAVQSNAVKLLVRAELSEYLNNKGLVYRTSEIQVIQANHSLWAQSIKQQVTQRIINDLQTKQDSYWPIQANSLVNMAGSQQLVVSLQRFNGVYTGVAEIAGKWLLLDQGGNILRDQPFHIEVPLGQDGYDAMISALSQGMDQLAEQITERL